MKKLHDLELFKPSCSFSAKKERVVLVSLSYPGYYSIPVRLLAQLAKNDPEVSRRWAVEWVERNNCDDLEECCQTLLAAKPALVAFSVNIWNLLPVQELSIRLKASNPGIKVLCGGQEVTNSFVDFLRTTPSWDYIVDGEGEIPFLQFLKSWDGGLGDITDIERISGLRYRGTDGVSRLTRPAEVVENLDQLPSIILEDMVPAIERNRLGVMLEGARGCNCKCTFCFEGYCDRKVRFCGVGGIENDVRFMLRKGARLFHLLDPIIASHDTGRTRQIMDLFDGFSKEYQDLRLSVEAYAERMDPEDCAVLGQRFVTVDLGLQSLNLETLKAIRRPFRKDRFLKGFEGLRQTHAQTNVYLICGLPFETPESYLRGVNEVVRLNPNQLFLNELVMLNGTELRKQANEKEEWGYVYNPEPPYDVRETHWMQQRQMASLNALSKAISNWYICSNSPSMLLHSRLSRKPLGNRKSCSVCLRNGKLYADALNKENHVLSNGDNGLVMDSRVLLCVEDAGTKDINAALTRLYLWGCSHIALVLPQSGLTRRIAESSIRLFRVELDRSESIVDDLHAFAVLGEVAMRSHGRCVELLWPVGVPLPNDPEFYRRLASLPLTVTIALGSGVDAEALLPAIDAAHAARVWVRIPAEAKGAKDVANHIWGSKASGVLDQLNALDTVFVVQK